jgi:hypothetical protein
MDTPPSNTAQALATIDPPGVDVLSPETSPVRRINPEQLKTLGQHVNQMFMSYVADRRIVELRWLNNQRQYLGIYDPDVEALFAPNRSRAYPKVTRTKVISIVSRIMNLMFQGDDENWTLKASPWPDITPDEVSEALDDARKLDQLAGTLPPEIDLDYCLGAVQRYADKRADTMKALISDQLMELGGSQALDYVTLNRRALVSGALYGMGVLWGPFAEESESVTWEMPPSSALRAPGAPSSALRAPGASAVPQPTPKKTTMYKPCFEFLSVWDFYPDMSAKTLAKMDGYFIRQVMTRNALLELGQRDDFFGEVIDQFIRANPVGNYRPQNYEQELRVMGVKVNVNEMKIETLKYEIIIWNGPISGALLQAVGCEVPPEDIQKDISAEIWMLEANVIKAIVNPWRKLNVDVPMVHVFLFDEDDTSPVGQGVPQIIRDSQMMVSAATRMLLDNASVVCGPNLELNTDLLRPDSDLASISAYKTWLREGTGAEAQWPAVREIKVDAHLDSLMKVVELGLKFADSETFVGPATGGDMSQAPSEPMRTAAGASMLRGDAALPFKDIIRRFDTFPMSIINAIVQFNRKLNPKFAPECKYGVIARGATSLIAKEVQGMLADQLAQTLTDEEKLYMDMKKLLKARLKARSMEDLMVSPDEAARREQADSQQKSQAAQSQQELLEAQIREILSGAFKNISQGQKNVASADAATVDAALQLLEKGVQNAIGIAQTAGSGAGQNPQAQPDQPGGASPAGASQLPPGGGQGPPPQGGPPGPVPPVPGGS